ncbi:GNAT family N-acetyltransferase [Streptomyces gobiensis]|uniref:GNAT family N-acetyltransferase n=1 Tax=Streptomyces gobiensis TaxID=2875706 RepID=UPI001E355FF7|nr:GNAT family N-acetyltransferase [Streptomyces gobiensis]UGY94672.1 GNAT family N-acetyltransferase [Streptomyces gobiensis]
MTKVTLRDIEPGDVDVFFRHQEEPDAVYMAAFTAEDTADREAYQARFDRILSADDVVKRTIMHDGDIAGHIMIYGPSEEREVTYWIGRAHWGRGIATRALTALLAAHPERPLYGRVAKDNPGSLRVLEKCGFTVYGEASGYAHGRGTTAEEYLLVLKE